MRRVLCNSRTGTAVGLLILLSTLVQNAEVYAAESYLQELEAEAAAADNTAQASTPAATAKPSWSQQQTTVISEKLEPGLSKKQFEESLKKRFYGSYLFYSTLNDKKQQVVYQEYQNNNDIEHLRDAIKVQLTN